MSDQEPTPETSTRAREQWILDSARKYALACLGVVIDDGRIVVSESDAKMAKSSAERSLLRHAEMLAVSCVVDEIIRAETEEK